MILGLKKIIKCTLLLPDYRHMTRKMVKIVNIGTPEIIAVIILKFEYGVFSIQQRIQ